MTSERTITPPLQQIAHIEHERAGHRRREDEDAGLLRVLDFEAASVVLEEHRKGAGYAGARQRPAFAKLPHTLPRPRSVFGNTNLKSHPCACTER